MILGKGPTDRLDDATLTGEKEYSINFTEQRKSLHYNGSSSYIFVLTVLTYINSKQKDSEINMAPLRLENVWMDFSVDHMENTGF